MDKSGTILKSWDVQIILKKSFFNIYKNIKPKSNEKNSKGKNRKIRRKNRKNK